MDFIKVSGNRLFEPEAKRLKGEWLAASSGGMTREGEACLFDAIDTAKQQGALSFALRAATSLARLWRDQGRCNEARELLAPVYNWFTEGFDLKDAKALLAELSA